MVINSKRFHLLQHCLYGNTFPFKVGSMTGAQTRWSVNVFIINSGKFSNDRFVQTASITI